MTTDFASLAVGEEFVFPTTGITGEKLDATTARIHGSNFAGVVTVEASARVNVRRPCPACKGTGKVGSIIYPVRCAACKGRGTVLG